MKLNTHGSLFDHACQIKDMKFSGFSPTSLRYTCNECGGYLILKLDRERWNELFGDKLSFRLTKKILGLVGESGAETVSQEEAAVFSQDVDSFLGNPKFRWEPSEDEDAADEE